MRKIDDKCIELLSPVGNFEIFESLIESKADAFYFGGKKLNMRMHRKNFNFTDDELKNAIRISHDKDKKVYITLNNLLSESDLLETEEFLRFLDEIVPDGIIFQDMAVLEMAKSIGLNIPLHASVMTNVASLGDVKTMEYLGVKRVIVSREVSLSTIKSWSEQTDMEFEYFVYGDMCVCQGGRCYYSGILLGQSSNRGRCMKPCRWHYTAKYMGYEYETEYPLAVKDMYMYRHIPEMIDSGIVSFKIEGRMRSADYIRRVVDTFGESLDRYIENPDDYDRSLGHESMKEGRMRDFSTAYAFGDIGEENFNKRYEGTGYFYSTGKVFSKPSKEQDSDDRKVKKMRKVLKTKEPKTKAPKLAVKVQSVKAAKLCIENQVDIIYLSVNVFREKGFSKKDILEIIKDKGKSKIILSTPQACFDDIIKIYMKSIHDKEVLEGIDGFLVTTAGALSALKNLHKNVMGDYTLNVYNSLSAEAYSKMGINTVCVSTELSSAEVKGMLENTKIPIEIIVHGSPTVMHFESDLFENLKGKKKKRIEQTAEMSENMMLLVDDISTEHPVYRDEWKRGHMLMEKDICYMSVLDRFIGLGVQIIRLEISHYSLDNMKKTIENYKKALSSPSDCQRIFDNMKNEKGFTLGPLNF